jgi:hypothetical protein
VDPWPMLEEGLMELEKAGELATALRWELEEAQRDGEKARELDAQADALREQAHRLRLKAQSRRAALLSMQGGLAHAVEAALGRPVPAEWNSQ